MGDPKSHKYQPQPRDQLQKWRLSLLGASLLLLVVHTIACARTHEASLLLCFLSYSLLCNIRSVDFIPILKALLIHMVDLNYEASEE